MSIGGPLRRVLGLLPRVGGFLAVSDDVDLSLVFAVGGI
jgi:hypothetical protein